MLKISKFFILIFLLQIVSKFEAFSLKNNAVTRYWYRLGLTESADAVDEMLESWKLVKGGNNLTWYEYSNLSKEYLSEIVHGHLTAAINEPDLRMILTAKPVMKIPGTLTWQSDVTGEDNAPLTTILFDTFGDLNTGLISPESILESIDSVANQRRSFNPEICENLYNKTSINTSNGKPKSMTTTTDKEKLLLCFIGFGNEQQQPEIVNDNFNSTIRSFPGSLINNTKALDSTGRQYRSGLLSHGVHYVRQAS